MSNKNLSFVVSSGPKLQNDPQVRTLIRRHAMKNVALTRKRRSDQGQTHARQFGAVTTIPIRTVVDPEENLYLKASDAEELFVDLEDEESGEAKESEHTEALCLPIGRESTLTIPAPPPFTAYEAVRSRLQVDLNDISMLTNFNVGQATISVLSADPSRLLSLLGYCYWSYLQFVPSRYGFSPCLTAAVNSVLGKLRGLLIPNERNETIELKLYLVALTTLQDALSDTSSCIESEVLCAAQLLGLHALLSSAETATWLHHIRGSTHLVKYRTPDRFRSDFDQALFTAHIGPVFSESLMTRQHCYLEEPEWAELYRSLARASDCMTERSPLAIGMRSQMFQLPGLWHDVDAAVTGPELFNEEVQAALRARCNDAHQNLLNWMEDYKAHCISTSLVSPSLKELGLRRELYGTAIECTLVLKRLLSTICVERLQELEPEVQALAHSLIDLQKQPAPKHSWLYAGREMGVAQSILLTKEEWSGSFSYVSVYKEKLATCNRYINWSRMLRSR